MKRYLTLFLVLAAFVLPRSAKADQPPFAMISVACLTSPDFGGMPFCFDTATHLFYYWSGTAFVASPGGNFDSTAPGPIGGTTPSTGAFTTVTGTTITATTGFVASAAQTDKALNVSNGGHISNPLGSGTLPTVGTGTVAAGGTDTAMRVSGGTSPVTVTFHTAFAVAPVCVCSNGTTAADGCKTSAEGTGSVVVTTAGTDTFSLLCIGK